MILHLAYGHRVIATDDKYVQISETAVTGTTEVGNPGSQVVDLFPTCEFFWFSLSLFYFETQTPSRSVKYLPAWLPGMAFKRHALRVRKDTEKMENMLYDVAKENIVSLAQCDIHETFSLSSVEIRFYDLLGRTSPRKSYSRRAGIGCRYTGYQGCCR